MAGDPSWSCGQTTLSGGTGPPVQPWLWHRRILVWPQLKRSGTCHPHQQTILTTCACSSICETLQHLIPLSPVRTKLILPLQQQQQLCFDHWHHTSKQTCRHQSKCTCQAMCSGPFDLGPIYSGLLLNFKLANVRQHQDLSVDLQQGCFKPVCVGMRMSDLL